MAKTKLSRPRRIRYRRETSVRTMVVEFMAQDWEEFTGWRTAGRDCSERESASAAGLLQEFGRLGGGDFSAFQLLQDALSVQRLGGVAQQLVYDIEPLADGRVGNSE